MKYSETLRKRFEGIRLYVSDLLLLESFQVAYLPFRIPKREFATLIRNYPHIMEFLQLKDPAIGDFLENLLKDHIAITDEAVMAEQCEEALWEIAELIVYNKHPERYDEQSNFNWKLDEIVERDSLRGKVVADVGAGSGQLAFLLVPW